MKGISYRPLADMHTDGVYFDKDEKVVVENDTICQYSGLPSVTSYEKKEKVEEVVIIGNS